MKKKYFILFSAIFNIAFAQQTIQKKLNLSNGITKNIKIFIPKNYSLDTVYKYPTIIVLDDGYLFDLAKGNAKLFADADLAPKQIVVGIPTDFNTNKDVSFVEKSLRLTKNSTIFYNFIKKEIIPYIKTNYRASPFFSIIGKGEASNFLTYFLQENNLIFNAYICINPNLNEKINKLIANYNLNRLDKTNNNYFLYVSHSNFQEIENIKAFNELNIGLSSYGTNNLKLNFDNFKNSANSVSVISESIPRAFSFIFENYRSISKKEYEEKIKNLEPLEAIKYLEKRYIDINYLFGTNLNVRLNDFYAIESIVIDKMDGDYLRVLGDFALIKHPDSPLGDYYIGKFHELGKNYKQAEFYYKEGYGKMDSSDPKADSFYQNIDRIEKLIQSTSKQDELIPLDDDKNKNDNKDEEDEEDE